MKKVLFTLLGALGMCLGICIGLPYTTDAALLTTVQRNVSATYTGWVTNDDGTYSYYEDGVIVCSKIIKIGTDYYAFNYEGIMYSDTSLEIYDEESYEYKYYRASASGALYHNEWYQTQWDDWYYYSEDCSALEGLNNIAGVDYYFNYEGQLLVNEAISTEQGNYAADGQGVLTKLTNNAWTKVGAYWYYVKDGAICEGEIVQIGTQYYYFDWCGRMGSDALYSEWNTTEQEYDSYIARADGVLYRNQWVEYGEDWYYAGDNCELATGLKSIGGTTYLFHENGVMVENEAIVVDGVCYAAASYGIAVKLNNNAWTKVGQYWYYVKDNQIASHEVVLISGQYYVFDSWGRMHTNNEYLFNIYQEDEAFYRAKASGTLYRNEWYHYEGEGDTWHYYDDDTWFYYGNDCKALIGLQTIGGKTYFFNDIAAMVTDEAFTVDGVWYAAASDGTVVKLNNNGWTYVGKYWYYVKNNQIAYDEVMLISGQYYIFDWQGRMITDQQYDLYDSTDYVYYHYRAKADGTLYRNEWYEGSWGNGSKHYFNNECKMLLGLQTIDGKLYYFTEYGGARIDYTFEVDGTYYVANEEGVLVKLANNGWTYAYGDWYYLINGDMPYDEILLISGKYYGFDYDGKMYCDTRFSLYDDTNDEYNYYRAKTDGTLCRNEWYQTKDGTWEYYGNDCSGANGIQTISGVKYYFYDGELYESGYAYDENGKAYLIGQGGVLVTNKKGWYYYDNEWYYLNSDGTLYYGLLTLGNTSYYMGYNMRCNTNLINIDGVLYQAKDSTGVLTKITADGFYTDSYSTYYVLNGKVATGWKYIKGGWRYFDTDGIMVIDETWWIDGARYAFDYNGLMYSNTWVDNCFYATVSGACAVGKYVIDGKTYYFDEYGYLDSSLYSSSGKYIINGIEYTFYNGWNKVGNDWYYMIAGELANYEQSIGGKYYYFDDYVMVSNEKKNGRYYGADGAAVKGWIKKDGYWYYADEDYYLQNGLTEINGVKYYFHNGCMATSDVLSWDGTIYTIGTNGIVKNISEVKDEDGWNYIGCRAYYFKDGTYYTGWLGESYISQGEKVFDEIIYSEEYDSYYYINKDGVCAYNVWCQSNYYYDDSYYYAGSDGKLKCEEWAYINGSWYYFDEYRHMTTGVLEEGGTTYYLDRNGKLIKTFNTITNGWHCLDGDWLYAHNGEFVMYGSMYIDGSYYCFDGYGRMYKNYSTVNRTYGADGRMKLGSGWYYLDGYWYYLNDEGSIVWGDWLNLNGNKYYLNAAMYTGYRVVDNDLYYFDSQGVCKGKYGVTNGWYSAGGHWYYFVDGKVVTSEILVINGTRYAFDWEGKMISNGIYYDDSYDYSDHYVYYYFGSDGAAVTKSGIYTTADGGKVYVAADGEAYTGVVYANGKIQYMDAK